jgi:hypothetical protein
MIHQTTKETITKDFLCALKEIIYGIWQFP